MWAMDKLLRHIATAEREAAEAYASQVFDLARVRRRDAEFLRRVLNGFVPWPEAFGLEGRK